MNYPTLDVDLTKIHHNARIVVDMCAQRNIKVWGVTKVFCGSPQVARAMVDAGVDMLADSRVRNLMTLKKQGFSSLALLRVPMISEVEKVVEVADVSLVSEPKTLLAFNEAAKSQGKRQRVVMMFDLGDLREGLFYKNAFEVCSAIPKLDNVDIIGVGTNLTCYGGVIPTPETLSKLESLAGRLQDELGWDVRLFSGGNSSSLEMVWEDKMPAMVNNLRIGEAIALGRETICRRPVPGAYQDTCLVKAEIVELQRKPSIPEGEIGQDAFGNVPQFEDRGWHDRAIIALGRQDVAPDGLEPVNPDIEVIGASSDHLLLALPADHNLVVGDILEFYPGYGALLQATTSPYVEKRYHE